MSRDLGFSDRVFGLGVGVFFIGYLALQIPGSLLAENWSARRTIAGSMVVWGSLTALTALVHTPGAALWGAIFAGAGRGELFSGGDGLFEPLVHPEGPGEGGEQFSGGGSAIVDDWIAGGGMVGYFGGAGRDRTDA